MKISNSALMQIAGWGGLLVGTTGFILKGKYIDNIRNKDFYRQALKTLRTHPGAVTYLGEPIKDYRFKITDTKNNFWDEKSAQFLVPLSGSKQKGNFYFWVAKVEDEWIISKAELELPNEPNRRLIIVKNKS